jgi:hypothetical protein
VKRASSASIRRILVLGGLAVLLAFAGPALARRSKSAPKAEVSGDAEAPETEVVRGNFDENSQRRLSALREWLNRRSLERKQGLEAGVESAAALGALDAVDGSSRSEYQRKMLREYEEWQGKRLKTLHIGRSSDGRVHHRYILRDAGTEITDLSELLDSMPDYSAVKKIPTDGRRPVSGDAREKSRQPVAAARMAKVSRNKSESPKAGNRRRR